MKVFTLRRSASAALMVCALAAQTEATALDIQLDTARLAWVRNTDERFQSYNIEMAELIGARFWRPYAHMPAKRDLPADTVVGGNSPLFESRAPVDLTGHRLRALAAALGPAYVRISGTWANSVYFQGENDDPSASPPEGFRGVLTRAQWLGAIEFTKATHAKLVTSFAVNSAVRDRSGTWTPALAQSLINYTRSVGGQIAAVELFNEPNFSSQGGGPAQYDGTSFVRDIAVLREWAAREAPEIKIAGPGDAALGTQTNAASLTPEDLLAAQPRPHFDIFDYHFYGAVSERCAPPGSSAGTDREQALSEEWLARTDTAFDLHKTLHDRYAPGAPIWLTETAGAACGGNPWSATFLDTFRYLDQLGRLAKRGVSAVFHNTLAASEYGLIDQFNLEPRPNYWAALLWRHLMGAGVLDAGPIHPEFHVYAHCLRDQRGGVALLAINLGDQTSSIELSAPAQIYRLTATSLENTVVLLNGHELHVGADDKLPPLKPERLQGLRATVSPKSVAFISVPGAANPACPK